MRRVAIDIGGTFTDVVGLDADGRVTHAKSLTSYPDPTEGFFASLEKLGQEPTSYLGHGTTLATNALLTRSGARTALITTRGFRDVLEIRRTHRKKLFDIYEEIPAPLVPRNHRYEITERIAADGSVVEPLDEEEVRELAAVLDAENFEAVAVTLLFSFVNGSHEERVRSILEEEMPRLVGKIAISSEILPLHREYERTSTTAISASLAPLLRGYLSQLEKEVVTNGAAQSLMIMQNTGGLVSPQRAADLPVLTLLSGPAGGAAATAFLGEIWDEDHLLAFDMGGTSTDVSAVVNGVPETRLDFSIGDFDISYPSIDIHTIGAGGGSQAQVDSYGRLTVGPESSGSTPGPVCYGRGGEIPTVTDALLILGYIGEDATLGGEIDIDYGAAEAAIESRVAKPLGLSTIEASRGIIDIVNSNMVHALRHVSIERGRDPRDYVLVPFGGAGPIHAVDLARELGIRKVLVPPIPGCNSALGILAADLRIEEVQASHKRLMGIDPNELLGSILEMAGRLRAEIQEEGVSPKMTKVMATLDLRYSGQAYDLPIAVPIDEGSESLAQEVVDRFQREHRSRYGHALDEDEVEIVNVRVTALGVTEKPKFEGGGDITIEEAQIGERKVYADVQKSLDVPVFDRDRLPADTELPSPAIIVQSDSTIYVPPDVHARMDVSGSIMMEW